MDLKRIGSKVKGFTLVELIVVMAIIAILAGILSTLITGFQRDARLESNNNKAHMIYTGVQNQLIQCEINQDRSLFDADAHASSPAHGDDELIYVELYFKVEQSKVSDTIFVASKYDDGTFYGDGVSTTTYSDWYDELVKAILSFVDNSFEGFCAVYIDYEDYTVDSAICVEPSFAKDVDMDVYTTGGDGIGQLMSSLNPYCPYNAWAGEDSAKTFRILTSVSAQETAVKNDGIYFGAYPTMVDMGG